MTVKELTEYLRTLKQDAEVLIMYAIHDWGDVFKEDREMTTDDIYYVDNLNAYVIEDLGGKKTTKKTNKRK